MMGYITLAVILLSLVGLVLAWKGIKEKTTTKVYTFKDGPTISKQTVTYRNGKEVGRRIDIL